MAEAKRFTRSSTLATVGLPRRRLLATAAAGFGALVLASCTSQTPTPAASAPQGGTSTSKPTAQSGEAAKPAAQQAPAQAGAIELNWFLPLSAAPEIQIWEGFVNRFQESNPNVTIKGSYEPWGDYWTKLQTVMAGGAIPDTIWLHYTRVPEWASKDVMKPLDPLLSADNIDPGEYVIVDAFKYKGKIYSVPKDNGISAMWFNIDMFEKAGVALPGKEMTWDQFLEATKRLTVDQSGRSSTESGFDPSKIAVWGTNMLATSPRGEGFYTWYKSMGGELYDDEMKQTLIDQPDAVAALQWAADLRTQHHVAPLPGAISEPGDPFRIGKVAIAYSHHAMAFFLHEEKRTFKWDETYLPQGKGGLVISGGATGFAIPKASKHPDEAWVLTKFMTGEEQQRIIVAQRRWAAGRTKLVPEQHEPDYHSPGYKSLHVDPLTGVGPQAVPAPSPPALAEIEQVWNSALDPVWLGQTQVKDVIGDLKNKIDELLQRPTAI